MVNLLLNPNIITVPLTLTPVVQHELSCCMMWMYLREELVGKTLVVLELYLAYGESSVQEQSQRQFRQLRFRQSRYCLVTELEYLATLLLPVFILNQNNNKMNTAF